MQLRFKAVGLGRMVCILVGLLSFTGCGSGMPTTYPVHGEVVFADGSPLKGGRVEFRIEPEEGKRINARGEIAVDGTFKLTTFSPNDGALAGEHEVVIVPIASLISIGEQPPPPEPIDPKYGRYETSGLKFRVEPGQENHCVFTVSPPDSAPPK